MMTTTTGQIYGGVFMILAGVSALLGRTLGWHNLWFLYPIATGLLMILAPWDNGNSRTRSSLGALFLRNQYGRSEGK